MRISFLLLFSLSLSAAELPISRAVFLAQILERNFNLRIARLDHQVAELNIDRERAAFVPVVTGGVERNETERPNTAEQVRSQLNSLFISEGKEHNLGIEGMTSSGARYRVGYVVQHLTNNLNNFDPEWVTFAGVNLTQPLLKGRGKDATMARLRVAEYQAQSAHQTLRRTIMTTVAEGESFFWDLYLAQEQRVTRAESLKMAEQLLIDSRERLDAGKVSELAVLQAEAGVRLRRTRLGEAEQARRQALNQVRVSMGEDARDGRDLIVLDEPTSRAPEITLSDALQSAFEMHPDYRMQMVRIKQEEVRLLYADNQRWPELNLLGSFGINGLGDSFDNSLEDLESTDFPAWSIGLEFRMPLGKSAEDAEFAAAGLRKQQALFGLKAAEIQLSNSIDTAIHRAGTAHETLNGLEGLLSFNEQVLEAEMQRLAAGKSDSRRVLEVEEDLADARLAYHEAMIDFQKSLLALELADGTLLNKRNIAVLSE
ncbi:MAG: outer membrane protein [Rhodothermales bacterium]|jgi:outer membrane protein